MDATYLLIGMLFAIFLIGTLNDSKQKEQIKKIRELTGLDLKEAKEYFDKI
ncbi:hypothetical protein ACVRWQ_07935 [Streptococcus phocae subsp. salmonis]|uniref:hypothetical protein n=1 Tax=Streptococcus phocae TaxID=119224 RepID=UPI000A551ED6|nr:hypothetical protein [Streptococcus phocae]